MTRRTGPTPRPGFTLIELLVVIAIIAILAALTTAAVQRVRIAGKRTSVVSDISQLDVAMTTFKQKYGIYPPAYIQEVDKSGVLQVRQFRFPTNTSMPEFQVLQRMWPRWPAQTGVINQSTGAITDPTYLAMIAALPSTITNGELDPNQVMVVFLGGPTQNGWDVTGPYPASASATTKAGPYYDFNQSRLTDPVSGTLDLRFRDSFGYPFAYFSAIPGSDTYDPRAMFPWGLTPSSTTAGTFAWGSAQVAVDPYPAPTQPANAGQNAAHPYMGTNKWVNPGKCQIISAGYNAKWGMGSYAQTATAPFNPRPWAPGGYEYAAGQAGDDDMANFNGGSQLGAAP